MSERMEMKKYLRQAYFLDRQIESRVEQAASLHALATKVTSVLSDMPPGGTRNTHRMEETVLKIIAMENAIDDDVDSLVDLKEEIRRLLKKLDNAEYSCILEQRYLNYKSWEQIAKEMGCSQQKLFRIHNNALDAAGKIFFENREPVRADES